jgi:hypothetical protein
MPSRTMKAGAQAKARREKPEIETPAEIAGQMNRQHS